MISKELAEKYHLPPKEEYPFGEKDWYETFLIQSDRDTLHALELSWLGVKGANDDYNELLHARLEARNMLEQLDKGAEK